MKNQYRSIISTVMNIHNSDTPTFYINISAIFHNLSFRSFQFKLLIMLLIMKSRMIRRWKHWWLFSHCLFMTIENYFWFLVWSIKIIRKLIKRIKLNFCWLMLILKCHNTHFIITNIKRLFFNNAKLQ